MELLSVCQKEENRLKKQFMTQGKPYILFLKKKKIFGISCSLPHYDTRLDTRAVKALGATLLTPGQRVAGAG